MMKSVKLVTALLMTKEAAAEQLPPEDMQQEPVQETNNTNTPWIHQGACPVLKNTISTRDNFNLEHHKLHGRWKAAYESKHRMRGMKCLQMKMKPVDGGEKHHMQSLIGQKIVSPEGDFTGGELLKDGKHSFFYDAESYLNFGHPEKKGLAAMQTRDDLFDIDHKKMKQDVHD